MCHRHPEILRSIAPSIYFFLLATQISAAPLAGANSTAPSIHFPLPSPTEACLSALLTRRRCRDSVLLKNGDGELFSCGAVNELYDCTRETSAKCASALTPSKGKKGNYSFEELSILSEKVILSRMFGTDTGCDVLGSLDKEPDLPVLSRGNCLLERELVLVAQAEFCSELEVVMLTEDREGNEVEACEALERAEGNCAGTLLTECYDRSSPGYRLRSARLGLSFLQSLSEEIGEDLSKLVPSCSSFFENRGIGKKFLENLSMSGGGGVGGHIPGRQASDGSEGGKSEFPLLHDFAAEAVLSYQPSHLRLEPGDVIAALEEKSDEDAAREKELKDIMDVLYDYQEEERRRTLANEMRHNHEDNGDGEEDAWKNEKGGWSRVEIATAAVTGGLCALLAGAVVGLLSVLMGRRGVTGGVKTFYGLSQ